MVMGVELAVWLLPNRLEKLHAQSLNCHSAAFILSHLSCIWA